MTTEPPRQGREPAEVPGGKHRTRLATLVFTDLVDSVALRRQLGDQAGATLVQAHRHAVRQTLARFPDADEVETAGDSFLLLFSRPSDAVKFALLVQMLTRAMARDRGVPLGVRIGVHVGEVVVEEHARGPKPLDLHGTQTDLCARLMGLAGDGQILLTPSAFDSARQALKGEAIEGVGALAWVRHGPYLLKGVDEPVEVCEVGEVGLRELSAPKGSDKARPLSPDRVGAGARFRGVVTPRWAAAAVGVLAVTVAAVLLVRGVVGRYRRAQLDRNVVAVAPFTVVSEPLQLWGEGMMDVLARALDGVGPLSTVSPTLVVRSWKGRADRTGATELGRAHGAGLAVYGQLIPAGDDSLKATVTVYDVRGDSSLGSDIVVNGAVERMDLVSDTLALKVFNRIGLVRPIGTAPTSSLGSRSLPGIKAFLRGEQLYRRNDFTAAAAAFEEALAADSAFALAYHRMRNVLRWFNQGTGTPQLLEYAHRAGALNHGLGRRDSLLILADSLLPDPSQSNFIDFPTLRRTRRRFAVLEEAAAAYPHDPEVWTELGEARVRNTRAATDAGGALSAFERAMTADSLFGPAYPSAFPPTLALRGPDSALVRARRYLRINPGDTVVAAFADVLGGDRSDAELRRVIQGLPLPAGVVVPFAMAKWSDADETAVRMFRLLADVSESSVSVFGRALGYRGHVQEAVALADPALRQVVDAAAELFFYSRFSAAAGAAVDSLSARWLADEERAALPIALSRAADRRDTVTLARTLEAAGRRATASSGTPEGREWEYIEGLSQAYLALSRGDSAAAARAFAALPDTLAWQFTTLPAVMDAARLFSKRGLGTEALALLDRHSLKSFGISSWDPWWNLEVARAAALTGDGARARASYAVVAAAWMDGDPPLLRELQECAGDMRRYGLK